MSEQPLDPTKFHILSASQRKLALILGLFFILVILPALGVTYYKLAVTRPSQTDKEITFEIKSGASVYEIARGLYDQKAVNSEFLFVLYVKLNGLDKRLQAGKYVIKAGTTVADLGNLLQLGLNDTKVTFLEGWRVEEYAREASAKFPNIDVTKFIELAADYEGYLFPDTYTFNRDIQEESMIKVLRDNFTSKAEPLLTKAALERTGLSKEQVVVLASIVEREANTTADRPLVAGVLLNRLRAGDRLDADATTQYASALHRLCSATDISRGRCVPTDQELSTVDWWPKNITSDDLATDSPYNTRKVAGLPPAPICNPSVYSIQAVLNFTQTDSYYYLTDAKGVTHYAKTLREHELNISRFL